MTPQGWILIAIGAFLLWWDKRSTAAAATTAPPAGGGTPLPADRASNESAPPPPEPLLPPPPPDLPNTPAPGTVPIVGRTLRSSGAVISTTSSGIRWGGQTWTAAAFRDYVRRRFGGAAAAGAMNAPLGQEDAYADAAFKREVQSAPGGAVDLKRAMVAANLTGDTNYQRLVRLFPIASNLLATG